MRRAFMFCVLLLSVALPFAAPSTSSAALPVLTIEQPTLTTPTSARLAGTATAATLLRVDAWVGGRWTIQANSVPVVAGRYEVIVPATTTPTRYRMSVGMAKSAEVIVVGGTVQQPEPEPEPEPGPGPEPEPEPETPPTGPDDDCGAQVTKADGTAWTCTLADDFDGSTLNRSVWMPQTIFRTGEPSAWACYLDDPSVISVANGNLNLSARKLPASAPCAGQNGAMTPYVAGMVTTYRLFSQQYGRFEARIKNTATTVPGLQETFWLWPDDRFNTDYWPLAGEIDISETYSQYPDLAIPFLHYTASDNGGPVPGLNTSWSCNAQRGVYNTFTLEWTATRIEIFINGTSCLVNTTGDAAFKKPYIVALTQLLGVGGNAVRSNTPLPATMSIDYVRVWE
jgi:beta-glucanase (GH16 family)